MECYTTPWQLWRESKNFYFFIEPSLPVGAPLSLLHGTLSVFFSHSWVHAQWNFKMFELSHSSNKKEAVENNYSLKAP